MTGEGLGERASAKGAEDARVVERCGFWHTFGRRRDAVGYYDRPFDGASFVRTFVCEKHARQAERETYRVVRNGGLWPEAS